MVVHTPLIRPDFLGGWLEGQRSKKKKGRQKQPKLLVNIRLWLKWLLRKNWNNCWPPGDDHKLAGYSASAWTFVLAKESFFHDTCRRETCDWKLSDLLSFCSDHFETSQWKWTVFNRMHLSLWQGNWFVPVFHKLPALSFKKQGFCKMFNLFKLLSCCEMTTEHQPFAL